MKPPAPCQAWHPHGAMSDGELILVAGALLAAGIAASLLAARVRLPGLLLFLGLGMVIGSDGLGWIDFSDYELARTIGIVALALILFEGGLTAGFDEIRPVLRPALGLALVGTFLTAAITGLAAAWLFDLSTLEGLLLGSIIASTDGAAIFALLRGSTLRRRLAHTLEGEAGFNDPVAVLLVIGFIDWIEKPDYGAWRHGDAVREELGHRRCWPGRAVGWLAVRGPAAARGSTPGLYPVATLATAAVAFGAADTLHGSGFLAAYVAGWCSARRAIPARRTVTVFHQGLALGRADRDVPRARPARVPEPTLDDVWIEGTALALARCCSWRGRWRPSSARRSTRFTIGRAGGARLGRAARRGAGRARDVPGDRRACADSREFFNIVFFAVVISTLVQGTTFEPLAQRLGVTTNEPALPRPLAETGTIRRLGAEVLEFPVGPEDARGRPSGARARPAARRAAHGDRPRRARRCCRAARRASRRATSCTWSCAARWQTRWTAWSSAGRRAAGRATPPSSSASCVGSRGVFTLAAVDRGGGRRRRVSDRGRRRPGARAPAHAPRPPRRAASCSPTAATRSPGRRLRWAARGSCRPTRGAAWRARPTTTARAWWQEVIGALAR